MDETRLYLCFEAKNTKDEPMYLIYSAKVSNALTEFTFETSIRGVSSMGCGLLDSKMVLAGGVSGTEENREYYRGVITYDPVRKQLSTKDIPNMRGRKLRPLVFEIHGRLCVMDSSDSLYKRSCEVYYPSHKIWEKMDDPLCNRFSANRGRKNIVGRTPYSWFVIGKSISLCSPIDTYTFFYHARQMTRCFTVDDTQPLPFHGMAITYWDPEFVDVVVISFSKGDVAGRGRVEGRALRYFPIILSKPQLLFNTDAYESPDGEVSSYFAECTNGKFCLTTFDNFNIHVYIFEIYRDEAENGVMSLVLDHYVKRKYSYNDFSQDGINSFSVSGCFVL